MAEAKKKLARNVTVDGRTYGPGDDVPADVIDKIRNPKAWIEPDAADTAAPKGPAGTSDGRKLASTVSVGGRSYGPGDFVPDDVAEQIRNPKAWADAVAAETDVEDPEAGAGTAKASARKPSKAAADKG